VKEGVGSQEGKLDRHAGKRSGPKGMPAGKIVIKGPEKRRKQPLGAKRRRRATTRPFPAIKATDNGALNGGEGIHKKGIRAGAPATGKKGETVRPNSPEES